MIYPIVLLMKIHLLITPLIDLFTSETLPEIVDGVTLWFYPLEDLTMFIGINN